MASTHRCDYCPPRTPGLPQNCLAAAPRPENEQTSGVKNFGTILPCARTAAVWERTVPIYFPDRAGSCRGLGKAHANAASAAAAGLGPQPLDRLGGRPTVHFDLHLKDGKVLHGDLPFVRDSKVLLFPENHACFICTSSILL